MSGGYFSDSDDYKDKDVTLVKKMFGWLPLNVPGVTFVMSGGHFCYIVMMTKIKILL